MEYEELCVAVDQAWQEFYHSLVQSGFKADNIEALDQLLDMKDCFNKVFDAVVEVNHE
jgi:hypothetical protein